MPRSRIYEFRQFKEEQLSARRFYSNLKKLCKEEGLEYENVYYAVGRKPEAFWTDQNVEVERFEVL